MPLASGTSWMTGSCDQTDEKSDQRIFLKREDALSVDSLCETCESLDVNQLFRSESHVMDLKDIGRQASCPFCRLVAKIRMTDPEICFKLVHLSSTEFGSVLAPDMPRFSFLQKKLGLKRQVIRRLRLKISLAYPPWTSYVPTGIQLLVDETARGSQTCLRGRRVDPAGPDTGLLLRWLSLCEDHHGTNCSPALTPDERDFTLRVIHTKHHCIVEAPKGCRYVALSYVWGDVQQLQLKKENYTRLSQHGSLSELSSEIPQSIKDAMILSDRLGESYLWVDALCIKQDDREDQAQQIGNMDAVYSGAVLTIVSAAGVDSNGGLPGVRPGSRSVIQHVERVKGMDLVTAQCPFEESVSSSRWETRGWTFQEKILSNRLLIFTIDQVFFHCNIATWFEDTELENEDPSIEIQRTHDSEVKYFAKPRPGLSKLEKYASLVHNYSLRNLTQQSDALNAFSGILNMLRPDLGESFVWGLPESNFDAALLWRRYHHDPECKREGFPSWSWAGWKRPHHIESGQDEYFATDPRPEVVWFRPNSDGSHSLLKSHDIHELGTHPSVPFESHAEMRAKWRPKDEPIPPSAIPISPSFSQILRFWTSSAFLTVGYESPGLHPKVDRNRYPVTAPDGSPLGEIVLNEHWRLPRPEKLEFIVVSRNVNPGAQGLNTLLIERCNGAALRVQRPEIPFPEHHWVDASPEWKLITLA